MEDCGCHVAGFGFTVAAALYAVWIVVGPIRLAELNLSHLWYGLITVFAGLFAGKFTGYTIARTKLSNTIRQIKEEWSSQADLQPSDLAEA